MPLYSFQVKLILCFKFFQFINVTVIHTIGHVHNFESFIIAYDTFSFNNQTIAGLLNTLSKLDNPYVNPIRAQGSNAIFETFKFSAGVTGIVMCGFSLDSIHS